MNSSSLRPDYVKDRVSVIIPTYNYSIYIIDCIDSVLSQNIGDMEIIVIDDGSTDNTREVLAPYLDSIIYIYQDNSGLSSARNHGLRECTGEFILFLDSDDLLGENSILPRLELIRDTPHASISVCKNRLFSTLDSNNKPLSIGEWPLLTHDIDIHLCYFNIAPPHAFLLHRDVFTRVGFFDEELRACEDYDYWLRCLYHGCCFICADNTFVYYRKHDASMSANSANQLNHDFLMHKRVYNYVINKNKPYELQPVIAMIAGMTTTAYKISAFDINKSRNLLQTVAAITTDRIDNEELLATVSKSVAVNIYYLQTIVILKLISKSSTLPHDWTELISTMNNSFRICTKVLLFSLINITVSLVTCRSESKRLVRLIYRITRSA